MKVTLLVPTLNEIEGMQAVMPRVKREWCDQIIILDGGSTDSTVAYSKAQGYFVYVQKEPGLRAGYREVLPLIDGDAILTFSPDGNCIPELIPALVRKMVEGYDMVIASRYLAGAWSEDDDALTAFGNWFFTKSINLLYASRYTDAMGIYRAYRKQIVYDLGLDRDEGFVAAEMLFRTRLSWEPLLSVRAAKRKLRVAEIPGTEPARIGGKRKLQPFRWGGAYYFQILREKFVEK